MAAGCWVSLFVTINRVQHFAKGHLQRQYSIFDLLDLPGEVWIWGKHQRRVGKEFEWRSMSFKYPCGINWR